MCHRQDQSCPMRSPGLPGLITPLARIHWRTRRGRTSLGFEGDRITGELAERVQRGTLCSASFLFRPQAGG